MHELERVELPGSSSSSQFSSLRLGLMDAPRLKASGNVPKSKAFAAVG